VNEDFDDLDPEWSIALYRIVQETLTNITKHAQANHVNVILHRDDAGMNLRVVDDGVGIPEGASAKPKSHGIVGMRERMRQVGGRLTIGTGPNGRGTMVEAFIPAKSLESEENASKIA
jgi:signal transduction histidine kinase